MGETFWVRLNQNPLPTLPIEVGERARRNWKSVSTALREKQEKEYPDIWDHPRCNFIGSVSEQWDNPSSKVSPNYFYPGTKGFFLFRPLGCLYNDHQGDILDWYFGINMLLGCERRIRYQNRCPYPNSPPYDQYHEINKDDFFQSRFKGPLFIDWDEDGDEDVGFLLETGGYIFFRRECCDCLVS